MKTKVLSKGYNLKIVSWENDADEYRTINRVFNTKDEAVIFYKLCTQLFKSIHSGQGVGNSTTISEALPIVLNYYNNNKSDFAELNKNLENLDPAEHNETIMDYFCDLGFACMGSSEWYVFRVCESVECTYLENDVYAEQITFE